MSSQQTGAGEKPANEMSKMFLSFVKIGTFTLGGGYAMLPMMQHEFVDKHNWLSKEEFMDFMAVSQAMPGLFAINMASHIGFKLDGKKGSIVGTIGMALPSIVCILALALFFREFRSNIYVEKIFMGIRPAVVALIASPIFSMARSAKINRHSIWIVIVSAVLISLFGVSPIYIILAAGIAGYLYGKYQNRGNKEGNKEGGNRT
jgi:chromate transporter